LGERFLRQWPQELLELPGLSRSSSLGCLGSSGATLLERAHHSRAMWLASLRQGNLASRSLVELLLVEGGALLGPISDGDGVVGAALALVSLR
jgi:hypothetical protein